MGFILKIKTRSIVTKKGTQSFVYILTSNKHHIIVLKEST
jgi:hypothetical protein